MTPEKQNRTGAGGQESGATNATNSAGRKRKRKGDSLTGAASDGPGSGAKGARNDKKINDYFKQQHSSPSRGYGGSNANSKSPTSPAYYHYPPSSPGGQGSQPGGGGDVRQQSQQQQQQYSNTQLQSAGNNSSVLSSPPNTPLNPADLRGSNSNPESGYRFKVSWARH